MADRNKQFRTGPIVVGVLPARYASSRFEGKVLARETGKFLLQHTYERAKKAKKIDRILVAADDERVKIACDSFGAECVMTSTNHNSGTDRIAEAVANINADIIINIQADEPEIDPVSLDYLTDLMLQNPSCPMATLAAAFSDIETIKNPNVAKVILNENHGAIYFSRSAIPYDRDSGGIGDINNYLRHLGIYAYRRDFLLKLTALPQSRLEKIEKLEQLRVLENGFDIIVGKVEHFAEGIDTKEQYQAFVERYKKATEDTEITEIIK
ncbi:MAG: 3-deoxy-manno-octulosonate cytidylyltransferase [Phycisphaerae bacterium]|nr:3-deoxy-manno-octulosonate cytidylyltransferase [Phycisphaerae bacterium]